MALLRSTSVLTPSFSRFSPLREIKNSEPPLSFLKSVTRTSRCDSLRFVCPPPGSGLQSLRCRGTICYAAPFSPQTLRWVSAVSSAVLMLAQGTAIQRSFLAPLFALQAPISVITWIRGEYGTWTAFLALLVRLFYFIPGELDLPFFTMLLVITAPFQAVGLRGAQAGEIISLAIAGYLAVQHFSRAGSLRRAFDQGSIIATVAVIFVTVVPCFFLI